MNFALLGDDCAALPLIRAIADHPEHRLTRIALADRLLPEILPLVPGARVCAHWDGLLTAQRSSQEAAEGEHNGKVDAVLIAGSSEAILDGAKQCASADQSLLVFPQAEQGAAFVYEMTLIRDDSPITLFPAYSISVHPLVLQVRRWMDAGRLGKVLYLQMEREQVAGGRSGSGGLLTVSDVDAALLPDLELLRLLGGDYDQVTALHTGSAAGRLSMATVTLSGSEAIEATWTLRPMMASTENGSAGNERSEGAGSNADEDSPWRLTVVGAQGQVSLYGRGTGRCDRLDADGLPELDDGDPTQQNSEAATIGSETVPFDPGPVQLEQFEAAYRGTAIRPDWTDLTRSFEIVEATHRSVRRRRTIDLHFETTSERSIFKTQMTALGCGVLTLTFFAVLILLMIGAMFDVNETVMRVARIAVFAPLFLFLILQFLLLVARPSSDSPAGSSQVPPDAESPRS